MLKENKRTMIITSIIILIPMVIGLTLWDMLPNVMATHFGFDNEANGFSSKALAVIGIPMILLALQWIMAVVTSRDPKKKNITPKMFGMVLWIIPMTSMILAGAIYPYNLGYQVNMTFISQIIVGMLFIIIGNYTPKMRPNYTIGIRVPWTLANEDNWYRTHRFAGYIWVAAGILALVITFTGILGPVFVVCAIALAAILPVLYSFWLHVKCGL